jgi:hypothetical protein
MSKLIKKINNNIIEFDKGSFDSWCVFLTQPTLEKYAPKDIEYFTALKKLGYIHGHQQIYNDFVSYYNLTNKKIDTNVTNYISQIASKYGEDAEEIDIWFTVIYAGMVAEENKKFAILKKRIKRLGMHQLLIDAFKPEEAANFSRGKKWRELDTIMKKRNF